MLIFLEDYQHGFYAVGDVVRYPRRFEGRYETILITLTKPALDCDCGKGLFCPLNTQEVER